MTTTFQLHVQKWANGCGSSQCSHPRTRRVYARGKLPCDVLFIGEAPGESENVVGLPFVGPAGKLLDQIVKRGLGEYRLCYACRKVMGWDGTRFRCEKDPTFDPDTVRVAFGNMVCCIPRESDGNKSTEPDLDQIEACAPRLVELVRIANPRLIVAVGKVAGDNLTPGYKHSVKLHRSIPLVSIVHPAWILRQPIASHGLSIQKCVIEIRDAVEEYLA